MNTLGKSDQIKKDITFFYTEEIEKKNWTYLKEKASSQGYLTRFSNDMSRKAEIGFYCSDFNRPENSKLSIVMLHGMDQGRNRWPNIWRDWPWHKFDVGLLPGKSWADRWKRSASDPYAHPKIAVCEVGSPKADEIYKDKHQFEKQVDELAKKLNLPYKKTVLYAPSFETDGKQKDLMNLLRGTNTNLLVKHWLMSLDDQKNYPDVWNNIEEINTTALKENYIRILPPETSIMTCLGLCDILVTDESSVAYEALLLNLPTFSIKNWVMRTNNIETPRPVKPVKNVVNLVSKNELKEFIKNYNKEHGLDETTSMRDLNFSNLGNSSSKILELVEKILMGEEINDKLLSDKIINKKLIILRSLGKVFPKRFKRIARKFLIDFKIMKGYFGETN